MPLRDENTKIRSIDDELKRLTEELGLVIDIPNILKEDESKKDEEKEKDRFLKGSEEKEDKE